ncbi:hypothetical protein MPTK1_7g01020 [Marchantia polymorpha subsp. ruderalis]|uniref:Alpha-glucan water dikinase-like N-terminal Ig-like domain-containing protein n=2 Tax=Marchantia polymorpha TaxID=3197 RepID=A0AAF6BUX3_MARPO|nr:hypothetical protein MARPO_0046s0022 [Marchantia polymorpha]BBN15807.1 hypothetical protein Mp_7g01020 [Marchantia polymorpha subsp. ruderalis]|eukprot:PTQ39199.1 hypothetical protein MARPO_0046s0022 [Marchantia polymorpha]
MMNSYQLVASRPGLSVVFPDCELRRELRKKPRPHDLKLCKAIPGLQTFTSWGKTPSCSLSLFSKRSTLLSSRLANPVLIWSGHKTRLLMEPSTIEPARQSLSGTSSTTTHFGSTATSEELEMEPQMDVKVSTFSFKEGEMLSVRVLREMGFYQVELTVREPDMTLHWGVDDWSLPDKSWWPDGTITVGAKSLETSFTFVCQDHWQVLMRFSETAAPKHLVFVLRDKAGTWYNNGGCFSVMVKPLELKDLMNQIVVPETSYSNWSLFSRFVLASNLLDAAEALGAEGMALVYTWLRFSSNKQLGWYRNCNYQSKDIAHVQERLASLMAQKVKRGRNSPVRLFARMSLSTLPRGGGDSEQIRMGILNIMREHGIKEGHRPGLEERFLEQWHQKLHTNTSPEDIHICEAYLEFLYTNSMDAFYKSLWDRGGVTKEWLEKMDHPISARPLFLPQLIPAFKHFLWVLKTVHSGADLDVAMEMSKKYMDEDLKDLLYHILSNRSTWWIPGKIVEARKRMEPICRADWSSRDVLMLDIALDSFFGLSISRIDKARLSTIVPVLYMSLL